MANDEQNLTNLQLFGRKLKELRNAAKPKVTQKALAKYLGLKDYKQINRYENGESDPGTEKLLKLGEKFKYDFVSLVARGAKMSHVTEPQPHYAPQNLDNVLPVGPVKTTLADYIALLEKHNKYLESGFNLGKILSNQSDGLDALTRIEQTLAGKGGAPSQDSWDRFQDGMNRLILTLADQQKGKTAVGSLRKK